MCPRTVLKSIAVRLKPYGRNDTPDVSRKYIPGVERRVLGKNDGTRERLTDRSKKVPGKVETLPRGRIN